ncbi:hypothetical protein KI387_039280, partial [Taxus chinensis]
MCQQSLCNDNAIIKNSEIHDPLHNDRNPVCQRCILKFAENWLIGIASSIVFAMLDLLDFILCLVYGWADYLLEKEWTPCYCCFNGLKSKRDLSETLYSRKNFVRNLITGAVCWMKKFRKNGADSVTETSNRKFKHVGGRWSDCACHKCLSPDTHKLYVAQGSHSCASSSDVIFIHGFLSSSSFWTETIYPKFSEAAKSNYRFFAVDLLGFGKSPKPLNCLYTVKEHVDMIEQSVIHPYHVKSFHLVAHSMGCIIALALASKYPNALKSITLLSPPYYPAPSGEQANHFVMKRCAPKTIWPLLAFGSSVMSWYEHVGRTVCLVVCKNHRFWEWILKKSVWKRVPNYQIEDFTRHTHFSAWHSFHNVICGAAQEMDKYLEIVSETDCKVMILHGREDKVVPLECSLAIQLRVGKSE